MQIGLPLEDLVIVTVYNTLDKAKIKSVDQVGPVIAGNHFVNQLLSGEADFGADGDGDCGESGGDAEVRVWRMAICHYTY